MKDKFNMSLEENIFLAKKELVGNVYSNAKLEGVNVTFPETKAILEGANVARLKVDEIQCILNLRDAWNYVINTINEQTNLEYICKINEFVARNESLNWGRLRDGKVLITGVNYIPEIPQKEKVEKDLEKIFSISNDTQRAIEYMLYGMRNQLFWDGNKRTSMIAANKIMIKNGKGIIRIADENLQKFSELLTIYYNTGKIEEIEEFVYTKCIDGICFNS